MSERPLSPEELSRTCGRYCDETISAEELASLERWLSDDRASMKQFLLYMEIHSAIAWQGRSTVDVQPASPGGPSAGEVSAEARLGANGSGAVARDGAVGDLPPLVLDPRPVADRQHGEGLSLAASHLAARSKFEFPVLVKWVGSPVSVTALIVCVVIALIAWHGIARKDRTQSAGSIAATELQATVVAELRSDYGCRWGNSVRPIAAGSQLCGGELIEVLRGSAKLLFRSGAVVVVEGPAVFELLSAKSMRLDRGTATIRAMGPTKDFVVVSPDAAIVDLGTSFGVHCEENQATEICVFEGAVEVRSEVDSSEGRALGLGASARIRRGAAGSEIDFIPFDDDRYERLLELLWDDAEVVDGGNGSTVVANFDDAPIPGTVDTFYGATRGRGWRSPWMAAGNPIGEIRHDNPLSGEGGPYLRVGFLRATGRVVAREFGARSGFDPGQPHVITWRWRFDGDPEHFGRHFRDRVLFYGRSSFHPNTAGRESWLIRLAAADEVDGPFRAGYPMHWCVFDGHDEPGGSSFNRRNLIDTGMTFKAGVAYRFAIVVYPQAKKYDAAIGDDTDVFVRAGLSFRSRNVDQANVAHFGVRSDDETADLTFSLDSVRVQPLDDRGV